VVDGRQTTLRRKRNKRVDPDRRAIVATGSISYLRLSAIMVLVLSPRHGRPEMDETQHRSPGDKTEVKSADLAKTKTVDENKKRSPGAASTEKTAIDATQNELLSSLVNNVSRTSNQRIIFSFSVILLILFTIAFALTDYIGFARGWSFFTKIVTGQNVTASNASTTEIYNHLAPLFDGYDTAKRAWNALQERQDIDKKYLSALNISKTQMIAGSSSKIAFEQLKANLNAVNTDCSSDNSVKVFDYLLEYGPMHSTTNIATTYLSLKFCHERLLTGPRDEKYDFAPVSKIDVDAQKRSNDYSEVIDVTSIEQLQYAVDQGINFISKEVPVIDVRLDEYKKRMDESSASISQALMNYLNVNKVDIGQDISFILSRIILIITLISLAATSLKVILNEIRFVNRLNELRIASIFALIHSDKNSFSNLYKSIMANSEIGKNDAEIGISTKDLKELAKTFLQSAAKATRGAK